MSDPTASSTPAPEVVAAPSPADAAVDLWFLETFWNRAIDPDEFNRLTAARDRLKGLLAALKE